jgi:hypothetical protein
MSDASSTGVRPTPAVPFVCASDRHGRVRGRTTLRRNPSHGARPVAVRGALPRCRSSETARGCRFRTDAIGYVFDRVDLSLMRRAGR